jgi:colanic acid biosynthesis glycosyl transferase WcaI
VDHSKKRALLITSNFYPENSGIAVYSSDLATDVLSEDAEVSVLTTLPHYPWWKIPEKFAHMLPGKTHINNLEVIRLSPFIPKKSSAMGRARFEYSFWYRGKKLLKKIDSNEYDYVVAIMPTVSSGLLARRVSRKMGIPGIVVFQDISSLGALQSGIPGGKLLYRVAKFLETRASKWASRIVVVSEAMIPVVTGYTSADVPIDLIHNYSLLKPSNLGRSEARESLNIDDNTFLILHSGNIGHKQDLLNVVEAAKLLVKYSNIKFLLVGHGNQEEKIRAAIVGCGNIELRSFFSLEDFPKALSSASVLLVNEISSLREMALPSKLTSYLASGSPVLAAVSKQSATRKFLGDAAFMVEPGNPRALADAVLKLNEDVTLREQLTKNAKTFSEEHLSASAGRKKYLTLFQSIRSQG